MLAWIADALPHADYLLPNDEQVLGFTGASSLAEGARALVEQGVGCVAVTQGSKGALVVTADEMIEVPAYDVDVVDTTGCGDAFSAGFLRGLSLGLDLRRVRRARLRDRRAGGRAGSAPTRGSTRWRACRSSPRPRRVAPEPRSTLGA